MADRLTHKQSAALLVLMALAREVTNPELRELVGFTLDGDDRKLLNSAGLVESKQVAKVGRPYAHKITEPGLRWCVEEMGQGEPPPPRPRSHFGPTLYLLLAGLDRHLRRERLALSEVFRPEVDPADLDRAIVAAHTTLAGRGTWVRLAELRPLLDGAAKADVDAVLVAMLKQGRVHLVPEADRAVLTEADHAAAVRVGGEDNHKLAVERS
ncbi:hypothetical protein [Actinokineospora pegani]|uniref:hypothetical protein n=1 Tax=Actinokineospora pegani TaxID=2654637 RepID=UPI0018D4572B|nr:hypothetical protein [Actinokineospora pegani]